MIRITQNQQPQYIDSQFPMLCSTQKALQPTIKRNSNDPSAGSPTETLLRLHLPLDDKIYTTSLQLSINQQADK